MCIPLYTFDKPAIVSDTGDIPDNMPSNIGCTISERLLLEEKI